MIRLYRIIFSVAILLPVTALLTSCGSEWHLDSHLEEISQLPLWQKLVAIFLSSLVSEDLACIAAGILASEGILTFGWALTGAILAIYLGDIPLYLLGRWGGLPLLRRKPFRWFLREEQILQAESLFEEHGGKLIFSSRLIPGSRLPIDAAAGVLNYPFWKFALYMFFAGGLSALILVWGSMRLGEVVVEWLRIYEAHVFPALIAVIIVVWLVVKLFEILATRRSRLVFLSRCRKLFHRIIPRKKRFSE